MIGAIHCVSQASVEVEQQCVGRIDKGLLILLGIEIGDDERKARKLAEKISTYRVFVDERGKTNLNIGQVGGDVLVVPQFTLCADTDKGRRPCYANAALPEQARHLYQAFIRECQECGLKVATGRFGADMCVSSTNVGPMTFWLKV